jgi:mRNA interferase RelE/StbE
MPPSVLKLAMTKEALSFIKELQSKQFKQIMSKVLSLMEEPKPSDAQPLKGYPELWRTDFGEFRIIYRFNENTVAIVVVGKRNDDEVYRSLRNKM